MSDEREPAPSPGHDSAAGHGHGDPDPEIRPRPLAMVLLAIAVVVLLAAGLMWFAIDSLSDRRDLRDQTVERVDPSRPAGPLLQAEPPLDLKALRQWENGILEGYGWVDRSAGVARVPVELARQRVLEQGFPTTSGEVTP